jgi:hypothetical protein
VSPSRVFHDFFALRASVDANTAQRTAGHFFASTVPRILRNAAGDLLQWRLSAMAAASFVFVPFAYLALRVTALKSLLLLEAAALGYLVLFIVVGQVYLESSTAYARVFIPIASLAIICAICGCFFVARTVLQKVSPGVSNSLVAAVCAVVVAAFAINEYHPPSYPPPPISVYRRLYDDLYSAIASNRRLFLPACFGQTNDSVGLGSVIYLGNNAVSLITHNQGDFDTLVTHYSIKYILVPATYNFTLDSREALARIFSDFYKVELPADVRQSIQIAPQDIWPGTTSVMWSEQDCEFETEVLRRMITERGGRVLKSLSSGGILYELPDSR